MNCYKVSYFTVFQRQISTMAHFISMEVSPHKPLVSKQVDRVAYNFVHINFPLLLLVQRIQKTGVNFVII